MHCIYVNSNKLLCRRTIGLPVPEQEVLISYFVGIDAMVL